MASSGPASSISRKRILANAQVRKTGGPPEAPGEDDAEVAAQNENAERILSKPIKGKGRRIKAKKPKIRSTTQVVMLGAIVITGIAAIIGLRYLAEAFGVNWIGD
jgi:hypothetical protein